MIELNFLPEELRRQNQATQALREPLRILMAGASVLVALHVVILLVSLAKVVTNANLASQLSSVNDKIAKVKEIKDELSSLENNAAMFGSYIVKDVAIAKLLYKLSASLPDGVWLDEFILNENEFRCGGSVISTQGDEVAVINSFLDSLKKDKEFISCFKSFVLVSVERKNFRTREIAHFTMRGEFIAK
jgi:Tfp pilus assembly protein PilN